MSHHRKWHVYDVLYFSISWIYLCYSCTDSILTKMSSTHQYICMSDWRIWSATSLYHQHFSDCTVRSRVWCQREQLSSFLSLTGYRIRWQDLNPEQGSTAWTGSPPLCSTLEETEPQQAQAREVNKEYQEPASLSYFTCLFPPVSGDKSVCRSTFCSETVN